MQTPGTGIRADEVRDWLRVRVADMLAVPAEQIKTDADLGDYGLDSVYGLTLMTEIEDHFQVVLEPTVIWDHPSIDELAAYLVAG